jgi:hypothetical protein
VITNYTNEPFAITTTPTDAEWFDGKMANNAVYIRIDKIREQWDGTNRRSRK